jgi:tetratricopeptide (TPR) repeat protein
MAFVAAFDSMHEDPPSYYEALSGAVERLERNTRADRQAIYDRARHLLLEEAHHAEPRWHITEIVREQRALEEAIEELEAEFAAGESSARRMPPPQSPRPRPRPEAGGPRMPRAPEWPAQNHGAPPQLPARMPRDQEFAAALRRRRMRGLLLWGGIAIGVATAIGLAWYFAGYSPAPRAPEPAAQQEEILDSAQLARRAIERGNEASRTGDFAMAIAAYTEAIKHGHQSAAVYNNRAYAYWSRGDTDAAIADYDWSILLEPGNIVALTNRAIAYGFRGDHQLALRDLDHAVSVAPENADILNSRCWGRALAGQLKEALSDCNDSLRLRPDNANALDSRGVVHLRLGQHDRAIADFDAALKLDPSLASALYGRGIARTRRGDAAGGRADMATARAIRPEIESIFARYGLK